ncbi:cystine ABC transporter [Klebsiella michiganensis]|uniref:Cystine ABC transporter n=1 Tax=Klebsiella michiganensis TaxID=1134687 RepID=A0A7H4N251_9ENTR|nr:cystine ABC transporter [Klebsiella michiganensis]
MSPPRPSTLNSWGKCCIPSVNWQMRGGRCCWSLMSWALPGIFADRVIFIENGVIHEMGTPEEVLRHPRQPRTQAFLSRFAERAF